MQISVREAAELLKVSERQVYRRIKDGSLPAHSVGGQYRFHRAELLEWALGRGWTVSPELFAARSESKLEIPRLSAALAAGGVHHDVDGGTPQATLEQVVRRLPLAPDVDRALLLDVLVAREALGSTAIGDGIAIPHVRNPIVLDADQHPLLSLCFLRQAVDFGALDGQPVYALFTLVCPTIRTHLQMLSRLAYLLSNPEFRSAVRARQSAAAIAATIERLEDALPAPGAASA